MDDKAKKYAEWLKQQRALEYKLRRESDEECIRNSVDKVHNHDYQKLPRPEPLILEPIIIPEKLQDGSDPFEKRKYTGDYVRKDRQPKSSTIKRDPEYWVKYWEENKEEIAEQRRQRRQTTGKKGRPRIRTEEDIKEQRRQYYLKNREAKDEYHRNWKERNRERARELQRQYKEREKAKKFDAYVLGAPSELRTLITQNGCNVCGSFAPLYNFRNEEQKVYTGCLCQKCLSAYDNMEHDENRIMKLRAYLIERQRINKQYEAD